MTDIVLIKRLLSESRTLAVVGLSADAARPSFVATRYMQQHGYRIIPVNPRYAEVLGETCYPDLRSIPVPVDIVDVFRPAEACAEIAREAVAIGAKVLWLQLGIVSEEARRIAEAGGLAVIMDRCVKIDHARLLANPGAQ